MRDGGGLELGPTNKRRKKSGVYLNCLVGSEDGGGNAPRVARPRRSGLEERSRKTESRGGGNVTHYYS